MGAARLSFRSRWAVLAALRIYGAIGRKVVELGPRAWDHRVLVSGPEKLRHVGAALWEAVRNKPKEPTEPPDWKRGDILIDVRMNQPIPEPNMEPLPE
jgi:phytoene synthase